MTLGVAVADDNKAKGFGDGTMNVAFQDMQQSCKGCEKGDGEEC